MTQQNPDQAAHPSPAGIAHADDGGHGGIGGGRSDGGDATGLREECAVFGIYGIGEQPIEASVMTALGLHALQHRGQEATGIVSHDGRKFYHYRGRGEVGENFDADSGKLEKLRGSSAIGHNRYSTTGAHEERNIQPFLATGLPEPADGFALAHNGNLVNAARLRESLVRIGALMQSTTDTEIIMHLAARSHKDSIIARLVDALQQVEGAWSLTVLTRDALIGCRDPHGVRPLVLGMLSADGKPAAHVLASETCAFDIIGAEYIRDLEPGEMVVINKDGITSSKPFAPKPARFCVFEYIYFARPDSRLEGRDIYAARKSIGAELAHEHPAPGADMVIPVPDSGVPAALGYAMAAGIGFEFGIIRNHYIGRTFILPNDNDRRMGVKMKHNVNPDIVRGKSVVLVDDSIVRGTTSRKIIEMVRSAGAREVHMRVASPPTTNGCYYGVDTPRRENLIAATRDCDAIAAEIHADSLGFLSIDGLYRALGHKQGRNNAAPQFCDACFSGDYPIPVGGNGSHTPKSKAR